MLLKFQLKQNLELLLEKIIILFENKFTPKSRFSTPLCEKSLEKEDILTLANGLSRKIITYKKEERNLTKKIDDCLSTNFLVCLYFYF